MPPNKNNNRRRRRSSSSGDEEKTPIRNNSYEGAAKKRRCSTRSEGEDHPHPEPSRLSEAVESTTGNKVQPKEDGGKKDDIHFLSVVLSIPHPDKLCKHGEDASLQLTHALGVFDGVGSWITQGVDSGMYTKKLSALIEENFQGVEQMSISDAVQLAVMSNKLHGTTTVCVAEVYGRKLYGLNVGDSGLVVLREGKEVFSTSDQQHEFNYPYQVGYDQLKDLDLAEKFKYDLLEGDIVLLASDGLWDNVYKKHIESIVRKHVTRPEDAREMEELEGDFEEEVREQRGEVREKSIKTGLSVPNNKIGKAIKKIALELGTTAYIASRRSKGSSPFSKKARLEGWNMPGGKQDDITIIVGAAVSEKDEKYRECIEAICSQCKAQ